MSDEAKDTGSKWVDTTKKSLSDYVKKARGVVKASGVEGKVQMSAKRVQEILDEYGVSRTIAEISATASDQLDAISGAKLLQLVEQRLELQARYNDILATKLDEALTRIELLEIEIAKLTNRPPIA